MQMIRLDHVNIRTSNLDDMVDWYGRILGLHPGKRPNFSFSGAWLYIGDKAVVHLVSVEKDCASVEPKIEHFALAATGMDKFIKTLDQNSIAHSIDPVPGFPLVQVNLRDIDGNHIHIDFDAAEFQDEDG